MTAKPITKTSSDLLQELMIDLRRSLLQQVRYAEAVDESSLSVSMMHYMEAMRRSHMQMVRSIERHYGITPKDEQRRREARHRRQLKKYSRALRRTKKLPAR